MFIALAEQVVQVERRNAASAVDRLHRPVEQSRLWWRLWSLHFQKDRRFGLNINVIRKSPRKTERQKDTRHVRRTWHPLGDFFFVHRLHDCMTACNGCIFAFSMQRNAKKRNPLGCKICVFFSHQDGNFCRIFWRKSLTKIQTGKNLKVISKTNLC